MLKEIIRKKEEIFSIIREAGEEISKVYRGKDFQVEMKSDETPLTLADKKSNRIIVNGLRELFNKIPFLSEESEKTIYQVRKKWDYFWLIDPLDGTKEFIKKNGEFTINLALVKGQIPIFGVVYLPVSRLLYYAIQGKGAYKIDEIDQKLRLPLSEKIQNRFMDTIRVVYSRSHYNQETKDYIGKLKESYQRIEMITVGSAIKLTYLAEGRADIYPRLGPTMEWDIAAGQIILEEAGGKVVDFFKQKPLIYNKEDLRNPWFVAFKNSIQSRVSSIESKIQ